MSICTEPVVPVGDNLTINGYADLSSSSFGGNPVSASTSVTISYVVVFDGSGEVTGSVTVNSGNSKGTATAPAFETDTVVSITITNITPSSFSTQTYSNGGTTFAGGCN
jgi:hypothetical protein